MTNYCKKTVLITLLFLLISTQVFANLKFLTVGESDGTEYTMTAQYDSYTYKIGKLFEMGIELTADKFGNHTVNIVSFYDIKMNVSIVIDEVDFKVQSATIPDIDTEGGSQSTSLSFNLSDISTDQFLVYVNFTFKGENTLDGDRIYGPTSWLAGVINVRKANAELIFPLLAIFCLGVFVHRKLKR